MGYEVTDFKKDVIERSHRMPVLVDFWAEWCGPCKALGPVIERLAERHKDRWELVKVNTDQHRDLAERYRIFSIPAVKLFVYGAVKDEFVGALPEPMIEQWLSKALPSPHRNQLEAAQRMLMEGRGLEGRGLLTAILEAEPENHGARVLLAQTYLPGEPERAIAELEAVEEDSDSYDLAEALRVLARLFMTGGRPDTLSDHPVKAVYLKAIDALKNQRYQEALEGFIETLQRSRSYDDEGARKACIAIFKALGENHDITRAYRRPFSNALYV